MNQHFRKTVARVLIAVALVPASAVAGRAQTKPQDLSHAMRERYSCAS